VSHPIQDIYCYACNDARVDPELATHLNTFGINVASQKKTEKSMTELVRKSQIFIPSGIFDLETANRAKSPV